MAIGQQTDSLVCYCYEITEADIRSSMEVLALETLEQIAIATGAGTGCTACHCRIQRMLAGLPATCRAVDMCSTCGFRTAYCECKVA